MFCCFPEFRSYLDRCVDVWLTRSVGRMAGRKSKKGASLSDLFHLGGGLELPGCLGPAFGGLGSDLGVLGSDDRHRTTGIDGSVTALTVGLEPSTPVTPGTLSNGEAQELACCDRTSKVSGSRPCCQASCRPSSPAPRSAWLTMCWPLASQMSTVFSHVLAMFGLGSDHALTMVLPCFGHVSTLVRACSGRGSPMFRPFCCDRAMTLCMVKHGQDVINT